MNNGKSLTESPSISAERKQCVDFAQQRCWLMEQLHPGEPLNTVAFAVKLDGALDVPALERAVQDMVRRNPALRTAWKRVNGQLVPEVTTGDGVRLQYEDVTNADAFARQVMELGQAPLLRTKLARVGKEEHRLLIAFHRAAGDCGALLRELGESYEGKDAKSRTENPKSSHILPDGKEQLGFWKELFKAPMLDLPADQARPAVQTFRGDVQKFEINEANAKKLGKIGPDLRTVLLAAFQALLHRYTGQEDLVVGTNDSIAVRGDFSGDPTFREVAGRVGRALDEARKQSGVPFELVLRHLGAERELSRPPLCGVRFEFDQGLEPFEEGGVQFTPERLHNGTSPVDVTLRVEAGGKGIKGELEYNCDLFTAGRIGRMAGHFQRLLEAIAADPEQRISRLQILTAEEKRLVVQDWNNTRVEYPRGKCIHDLFREQVERTPDATAVTFEDRRLTYHELDAWSSQVAERLQAEGIEPDTRVGVCMNRGLEMIVALFAIHKAGGAYVPMDPGYPQERLVYMLEDAQTPVLVTEKGLTGLFPGTKAKPVFVEPFDPKRSSSAITSKATSDNLAYVIYTSGSTGKPKGVMVRHRNAVNFFTGMDASIGREPGVWLAVTSISFDISVLELFWTLTRGFKVVLQADGKHMRPGYTIAEQIKKHAVTHFQCTPSMAAMLLEDPKTREALLTVKKFFFGGEPMPPTLVEGLKGPREIFNMYGPTETTVWSTVHPVTRAGGRITIGRPIANTGIYILDKNLQPCPIGVPGELWIGGDGVVRGYLNRPELTAERFVPNPFSTDAEERIYRTGDLARFREDGEIEFLGRVDFQVKLRGFRIELGEIEAALRQHATVKECVVTVWQAGPNDQRLAAYLVPQPGAKPQTIELRRWMQQKVPDYMVPSVFTVLEAMPLTPNGKIDRKALAAPEASRATPESKFVPPATPLEKLLARIFEDTLGVQPIGLTDNFFEFGGTVIAAAEAQGRIQAECETGVSLKTFFQHPSVGALTRMLTDKNQNGEFREGIAIIGVAERSLTDTFSQRRTGAGVGLFDAAFFGMSAEQAQRIAAGDGALLECAWEAFERAGYDPAQIKGAVGIFTGGANGGDCLAALVSTKLNLRGPSMDLCTGESSALNAVYVACQHLLTRACDLALAGGVSDGKELGVVVLKRFEDALANGDQVLAVIKGFPTSQSGTSAKNDPPKGINALVQAALAISANPQTISAFGNAQIILEVAPVRKGGSLSHGPQLLVLSARSEIALENAVNQLRNELESPAELNPADVAFTLATGRRAFNQRWAAICRSARETIEPLANGEARANPAVVFMLSGEGALNAGRELYDGAPQFRREVDRCTEILAPMLDLDIRQILYPGMGSESAEAQPVIREAAQFVLAYARARLWMSWGVRPETIIGDECVAACLAGVFSLRDALTLVASSDKQLESAVQLRPARIPFISNATSDWITAAQATDRAYWTRQPRGPVRLMAALRKLLEKPERMLLEVGPRHLLSTLAQQARPVTLSQNDGEFATMLAALGQLWVAGVEVDWRSVYAGQERRRISLPTYPFERRQYAAEGEIIATATPRPDPLQTPTISPQATRAEAIEADVVRTLPLTDGQKEIWFACQLSDGASCAFNESCLLHLKGALDEAALTRAIQNVVDRHEALRTTFSADGDVQYVHAKMAAVLRIHDLPGTEKAADDIFAEEVQVPFDLTKGPLTRFRLIRKAPEDHVLVVTVHHSICDGGSLAVLLQEISEFYSAERKGQPWIAPAAQQFQEFATQQQKIKTTAAYDRAEKFWLKQFAEAPSALDLPSDHARSASRNHQGAAAWTTFDRELIEKLKQVSRKNRCTLFTTVLASFYAFLNRLSGQKEIVVGIPTTAREGDGSERLIGHCVNFLPLRLEMNAEESFAKHLTLVRELMLDAHDHQNYTFGNLLQKLTLGRDNSRPLISVMFNLDWTREELSMEGLQLRTTPNPKVNSHFDLSFNLVDSPGEFQVQCVYSRELFEPETIERWFAHFRTLLEHIATKPETAIGELRLLGEAEKRVLLEEWNRTQTPLPQGVLLQEMFEARTKHQPQEIAIREENGAWTYEELNRHANQVAHYLNKQGVRAGTLVGVCMGRSRKLLATLLGIMKAGAAYVPLDPEYPKDRLRQMMQAAQTELIVTTEVLGDQLFADMHVVLIDRDWTRIEQESHAAIPATIKDNDLAYVMFTSGSTGGAKAVGLEHRNAVAFVHWARLQFAPEELSGVFASTSICFDLSVFELFVPLSWGGTIVLADNPMQLATHVAREHVRLVNTVPSAVPELLKAGVPRNVTTVNLAGEALAQTLVDQLYEAGIQRVYDLYGPTENTTYSTCALRTKGGRATIGRPLANTEAYIVDAKVQPVPIGVPGELMVGGALLTRGYLHQPELTGQKFIPHPFRKEPGARLYRTGDLARFLSNGDIEFLGRIDHQIKIRGYRIEPGDIEAEIQKHPAVEECVAVLREDTPGQKQIAAYIASRSGEETSAHEMRNFLRERLPAYMIPATFTFLEKLPLTPNGKLDRRALPAPDHGHVEKQSGATEEEPLSEVEQALAQIWREVIGVESVGRHDNFFDLGGHSILITQIVSRCRNTMGVELSLRNFFEAPTVGELAPMIEQQLLEQLDQIPEAEAQRLACQLEPVSKGAS